MGPLSPSLQPRCPEPSGLTESQVESPSLPRLLYHSLYIQPSGLCLQPYLELQVFIQLST